MGRADVLFYFLRRVGKDQPSLVDKYIGEVDLIDASRPLAEQIIDQMLNENPNHASELELAKIEAGPRDPYSPPLAFPQPAELEAMESFIREWVKLEHAIRSRLAELNGSNRAGGIFNPSNIVGIVPANLIAVYRDLTVVRNRAVHGEKPPSVSQLEGATLGVIRVREAVEANSGPQESQRIAS